MNEKELKKIARQIVELEKKYQAGVSHEEELEITDKMSVLAQKVTSLDDMERLDDMVYSLLKE